MKKLVFTAFLVSLLWVSLSGIYVYNRFNFWIGPLNITPVLMWTAGLTLVAIVARKLSLKTISGVTAMYWCGLIVIEYIGYYLLEIRRIAGDPGIFGSAIIHIPFHAYPFYIMAGPLFYLLTRKY